MERIDYATVHDYMIGAMMKQIRRWLTGRRHRHHHHRHHHHRVAAVLFSVDNFSALIEPNQEITLMTDITLGHGLDLSITYLDQDGNVMLTTPTPDSPPVWSNTTEATETLIVAADGLTAQTTSVAVGADTVSVTATVGGVAYSASLIVNVQAPPQVLTSIAINAVAT
jgi:hypothetical protein